MLPPYSLRTSVLSPVPLVEDVGRQVVDELVAGLLQRPARLFGDVAVARAGGVAAERAAGHRRRPEVVDAAAIAGGVAGEGAVVHRQRHMVVDGAARTDGRVFGEGAVAHRRRPAVEDAAAVDAGEVAGEGAAAHRQRPAVVDASTRAVSSAASHAR